MHAKLKRFAGVMLAGASALALLAGTNAAKAEGGSLEGRMSSMEAQLRAMQKEEDETDLKVKWKGAPEFSNKDDSFKFKIRGRLQADGVWADQDEPITGAPDVNATEIRRAMIGVQGVMYHDIKYIFEILMDGSGASISDANMTYTALPADITLGQFKTYNSLEELTSSRFLTFMERAAFTDAFGFERQIGVGVSIKKDHWTAAAGGYSGNANDVSYDMGNTFAARVTAAPINEDRHVLHLGASVRHRDNGSDQPFYRYAQRAADFHLTDRFVDTGRIGESDTFWGLEGAWVYGPFSVQGEYAENNVDMPIAYGGFKPNYNGWYVDASYFLTGESRTYTKGTFSRIKVNNPVFEGGLGAWQIAGRYDVIDLGDKATEIANFGVVSCDECGEQKTWLLAVNWWLNDYTRVMLNVNQSEIDGGVNDGADVTGVGTRFQIDW